MLLVLTVCDTRAVGPGVWNGWTGQLLRTLYWETEVVLAGGHSAIDRKQRVTYAQDELRRALPLWSDPDYEAYAARHYQPYWLKVDLPHKIKHAGLLHVCEKEMRSLATEVAEWLVRQNVPFRDAHEITGELVQFCEQNGLELDQPSDADYAAISPHLSGDVRSVLTIAGSVASRTGRGGTAPVRVAEQLTALTTAVATARKGLS
jgi:UTP:GlnB (protein PII) uridylyltransferase